tara:strand:+ start:613 stop:1107 length:495 start_codon:yes stop_codon:yes gene_type:complete
MDYQNLYDYSKDISQNLGLSVNWVHADKSWLNLIVPNKGITCWSLPFTSSISFDPNFSRTWTLAFVLYQQDLADSDMDQNDQSKMQESIRTLSNTDRAVNMFIRMFESNDITTALDSASQKLLVTSVSTEPAIRDTAQQLTGTLLTITAQFPDDFDYCCVENLT